MRQRLGLAGVLLGDPHTVILDEPANGLDPEGIRWIRDVLVHLARQGRTVLVSSHLLSEIALMADDLVVIGRGRLIEQGPVEPVHRPPRDALGARAHAAAGRVRRARSAAPAASSSRPGRTASTSTGWRSSGSASWRPQLGVVLHELSPQTRLAGGRLPRATAGAQEYRSGPPACRRRRRPPAGPPSAAAGGGA